METVSSAGCVFSVSFSCVVGSFEAEPRQGEAQRLIGLLKNATRGGVLYRPSALPIPANWEPWPGNRNAVLGVKEGL